MILAFYPLHVQEHAAQGPVTMHGGIEQWQASTESHGSYGSPWIPLQSRKDCTFS